jgi:hypothetical protein
MALPLVAIALGLQGAAIAGGQLASREQEKAQEASNRIRSLGERKEALGQIRRQRIAQSQIRQAAATQGTGESSSARGGFAAVGSATAGNLQYLNQVSNQQDIAFQAQENRSQFARASQGFTAFSNLALQAQGIS